MADCGSRAKMPRYTLADVPAALEQIVKWGPNEETLRGQAARLTLAHLPTPLEPLERLSSELGGPRIYVKRDDCTGLAGAETRRASWTPCWPTPYVWAPTRS